MMKPITTSQMRACKILGDGQAASESLIIVGGSEARIAMAEGGLEIVVQHGGAYVEEGLHGRPVPAHLLLLVVDRPLHWRLLIANG
jgi:hypothetical protein